MTAWFTRSRLAVLALLAQSSNIADYNRFVQERVAATQTKKAAEYSVAVHRKDQKEERK